MTQACKNQKATKTIPGKAHITKTLTSGTYLDSLPRIRVGAIRVGARGSGPHGISGFVRHVRQRGRDILDETGDGDLLRKKEERKEKRDRVRGYCRGKWETRGVCVCVEVRPSFSRIDALQSPARRTSHA